MPAQPTSKLQLLKELKQLRNANKTLSASLEKLKKKVKKSKPSKKAKTASRSVTKADTAELKRTQLELKNGEFWYEQLMEQAADGIFIADLKGNYTMVNTRACEMVGYSREELLKMNILDLLPKEDHVKRPPLLKELLKGDTVMNERRITRKDGSVFHIEISSIMVDNAHLLSFVRDISERKRMEDATIKSEERFRSLVQNASDVTTILEIDGTVRYESPAFFKIFGYEPEEIIGKNAFAYVHPDDLQRTLEVFQGALIKKGLIGPVEFKFRKKDGTYVTLESIGNNMLEDGIISGFVVNSRDITERKLLSEELEKNSQNLMNIVNASPFPIIITRLADATVLYINQRASDLFRIPISQALGKKAPDYYVYPEQRQKMVEIVKKMGFVMDFDAEIKNDYGYRFWALVSAQELTYNNEACILVGINNINERKEIETQLRISENNYRDLFEKNPLPMWVYDLETFEFLNVNNAAILHYGYSKDEFLSMTIKDIRPKEELDKLKKHVTRKLSGLFNAGTFIHMKKDGSLIQVDVTAYPVVFNSRKSNLILAHDITERLTADEKLKANEELLKSINANIREGLYRSTPESGIIYVNEAFSEMFGYDSVEDVLKTPSAMLYDDPARREQLKKKIIDKGHFTNEEVLFLRKDGTKFWALVSSIKSTDKEGNLYFDGAVKDITDRKQADEKLIYSETLLKNIFNESTDALFLADAEKREILTCNNQAVNLFDAENEQALIGKNTQIFRKHKILDTERDEIKNTLDEKEVWTREVEYVSFKGKDFWGSVAVKRIKIGSIAYDLVRITDITERKKAEEKLIYNETLLKNIFNESTDALFLMDAKERQIISCNRRAIELFETANENGLIGTPGHSLRKRTLDKKELTAFSEFLNENSFWTGEIIYLTKKGNEFLANVAVQRIKVGAKNYELARITDITELKRSEESIKNSLQEKEILLEEIHHRVKNNLAVISGLLYLQAEYVKDNSTKTLLNESQNRIRSMALIHEKLYQSSTLSKIDFGEYAVGLIEQIKYAYPVRDKKIEVEVVSKDIFLDIAHAVPCGLILNELVSNAYKYAFRGRSEGLITITFTKEAEGFVLRVADNGIGIQIEKDINELTSLGLTLVNALVSQLKGKLEIKNENGTVFIIKFM